MKNTIFFKKGKVFSEDKIDKVVTMIMRRCDGGEFKEPTAKEDFEVVVKSVRKKKR